MTMAHLLQAVRAYGPRLELEPAAGEEEIIAYMERRTGLNASEAIMMLYELHDAILYFNRGGRPVKLPRLGTFTPSIDRHGTLKINFRPGVRLKKQIKQRHKYRGVIQNQEAIGLDNEGYKERWDADHPDDPLQT